MTVILRWMESYHGFLRREQGSLQVSESLSRLVQSAFLSYFRGECDKFQNIPVKIKIMTKVLPAKARDEDWERFTSNF